MKTKTSVTLSPPILHGIEEHATEFRSRSDFIEAAVRYFIGHLEQRKTEQRDMEILNRNADALNKEAADVLGYQVPL